MNFWNKALILASILLYPIQTKSTGQTTSLGKRIFIETNAYYGFVVPHHNYIAYFVQEHVKGYQVNIGLYTNGEKSWHQHYNYPNVGLGIYHSGLGNREVFGHMNAIFAFAERFFFKANSRFNIGNRLSYGISYIDKMYDIDRNNFDIAIGSHINVFLNYNVEAILKINPQLTLKLGGGFIHTSNGSLKLPNKGLNLVTSLVGFQYSLHPRTITKSSINQKETDERKKNQFIITVGTGYKQIEVTSDKSAVPLCLSLEYGRKIVSSGWLGSSLNFYYDPSIKQKIEWKGDSGNYMDNLRVSFNLSYELRFGKLGYIFQPGIYLKNSYPVTGVINNRLGIRYHLNRNLLAGITIKAHWFAIADFIEFGIGYKWHK